MKMPFMFALTEDDGFTKTGTYVVMLASNWCLTAYACEWMNDPQLGDRCLVPGVDACEHTKVFDSDDPFQNELDALAYMKQLWSEMEIPTAEKIRDAENDDDPFEG